MATPAPADSTTAKPPRPRRWIPVSLRMFVAMLGLLGLGSVFWIGMSAYRQFTTIQEIERLGGAIDCVSVGPEWLRRWVGHERMRMFDEIVNVRLADTQATDDTVRLICGLVKMRWLNLDNTRISDLGLAHLKGSTSLKWLWIENTQVTDAGLAHLNGLTSLELIHLGNTRATKAGVDDLVQATGLTFIGGGPL